MIYPSKGNRFVGTTEECFRDFINRYSGLKMHALLGEFCFPANKDRPHLALEKIQRWQREDYIPGGDALLRLRCFLHLAGYAVTELESLNGNAQKLALIVGLGLADPAETETYLGYQSADRVAGLWRITLHGGGHSDDAKKKQKLRSLLRRHQLKLTLQMGEWMERIKVVADELAVAPTQQPVAVSMIPPGIPAAFARLVAANTALATVLLNDPEAQRAAVEATRGGQDLMELRGVLQQFFPPEEESPLK